MIWGYSASFKLLATAGSLKDNGQASSFRQLIGKGFAQQGANILAKGVGELVRKDAGTLPGLGQIERATNIFANVNLSF